MKKLFLFLLLACCFSSSLSAQNLVPPCGLSPQSDQELIERLRNNKSTLTELGDHPRQAVASFLPIVFHLVRFDDGSEGADPAELLALVCQLNDYYAAQSTNLQFLLQEINMINSTDASTAHRSSAGEQVLLANTRGKAINVFLVKNANTADGSPGTTLAYYASQYDWIIMRNEEVDRDSETLAHEIGHFLGLPHPFRGWDFEPYDPSVHGVQVGDFSPSTNFPNTIPNEKQDGSNCENAGDEICDTPPDYNHAAVNWNCNYTGGAKDPNGTLIDPDEKNIMGYFISCAGKSFSEKQKALMGADLFNRVLEGSIVTGSGNSGGVLGEVPSWQIPAQDGNRANFSQVDFSWEEVANAQGYMLQIDDAPSFAFGTLTYLLEDNFTTIKNQLNGDKKYYWRVKAFNANNACGTWSPVHAFTTFQLTNTAQPEDEKWMMLYTNPVPAGEPLVVTVKSTVSEKVSWQLFDLLGRPVLADVSHTLIPGEQKIGIPTEGISSGYYLLVLRSAGGQREWGVVLW